ncbi:AzlC family ABC transporter permease [Microlunatus panaciterrae]|uniref:4-azaleucine resistance transporter AzlC n=1 Tax=Microlunatus panaciterrae TaxID=400768 RepID=A0ABS2RIH6_9ACTN|nr:AzlC family ABC transporter permease [Microlunatus panaciterrae]MBM7798372.1 4-azaleucine resistance transporter AzlC [Microlunatus panaciterrae]
MRSIWRTLGPVWRRHIALLCLADAVVGASFGALAMGSGLPGWLPVLLSLVVFAGAAQFMFVGILAAGGNPFAAVAAGLLVNARHLPFGFAVREAIGHGWLRRLVGSHLMADETVAFTLAEADPARRRVVYWATGMALFVCWNLGVLLGVYGGTVVHDTDALGLDAAFPAVLVAVVLPALRDPVTRRAALVGAAVALAATTVLPAGLPVLLALVGVLFAVRWGRAKPSPDGSGVLP